VKLVINQFTSPFTVTPSSKPTLCDDTTAPEGTSNNTILAVRGKGVMSAVVHNGVLTCRRPVLCKPDDGGGVRLVACTLGNDDVLATELQWWSLVRNPTQCSSPRMV
jgi:hypothetical protein